MISCSVNFAFGTKVDGSRRKTKKFTTVKMFSRVHQGKKKFHLQNSWDRLTYSVQYLKLTLLKKKLHTVRFPGALRVRSLILIRDPTSNIRAVTRRMADELTMNRWRHWNVILIIIMIIIIYTGPYAFVGKLWTENDGGARLIEIKEMRHRPGRLPRDHTGFVITISSSSLVVGWK